MDSGGWIDLGVITSFNRMLALQADASAIVEALKESKVVEFNYDNTKMRRRGDFRTWLLTPQRTFAPQRTYAPTPQWTFAPTQWTFPPPQ